MKEIRFWIERIDVELLLDNIDILIPFAIALLNTVLLIFLVRIIIRLFRFLTLKARGNRRIQSLIIRDRLIISRKRWKHIIGGTLRTTRFLIILALLYFYTERQLILLPESLEFDFRRWIRVIIDVTLFVFLALLGLRIIQSTTKILIRIFGRSSLYPTVRIQNMEILTGDRISAFIISLLRLLRIALSIVLVYFFVSLILGLFAYTETWSQTLLHYLLMPLRSGFQAFIDFIPNIIFIAFTVILARYAIRFSGFIFQQIERKNLRFSGFYPDWARPTQKIVSFIIIAFSVVLIFPYLPGANSEAFRGISIFFGVLISLGSTAIVANIVAGIVITYMRPFLPGDRVQISETVGDVVEKNLLVTRIRSIKNVDITIPNSMVLSSHIINFSAQARERGLILHTEVTIGYDIPWQKVHELLMSSVINVQGILKAPEPFVLQKKLGDYSVTYEINVYTDQPHRMAITYSDIHAAIQDHFNEAGIEILSPTYSAIRDGNTVTNPENYRPVDYSPGGFLLNMFRRTKK